METHPALFTPVRLGAIELAHRVVMAPLTRLRSEPPGDVPGPLMAEYYGQRASAGGLMVTESAEITPDASGYEVAVRLAGSRSRVVLMSSRAQQDLGRRVQRSGALGFVSKDQLSGAALCALLDSAR